VSSSRKLPLAIALPATILLALVGVYAVGDAVFSPVTTPSSPGFLEVILASRAVVAAVRIAVIFAAAFIVVSVVALIAKGRWLTRVGPVQITGDVSGLEVEVERLEASLAKSFATVDNLRQELSEKDGGHEP
jgi:mannose/fructose/N-acetylgalactosamine-specific phosphotransferase system component IIC